MQIFKTRKAIFEFVETQKKSGRSIGFVPTMGALHEGHIALVRTSQEQNQITIVSIFVNPTQFNNPDDYKYYPGNIEKDKKKLQETECDALFNPDVQEMYPEPDTRKFDFGDLEQIMEGKYRPGHFNGVAQIVSKLLDAIPAHRAYFGQKDFQQLAVVRKLVADLQIQTNIIACPIIREPDGLAMSSRNNRLTDEQRNNAPVIYQTLLQAKSMYNNTSIPKIKEYVTKNINKTPDFYVEYFEIVDHYTLQPVNEKPTKSKVTACIAVQVKDVRLIDNMNFF